MEKSFDESVSREPVALKYLPLTQYPLQAPEPAKYIIAQNAEGEEFLVAIALRALPEVFHDDILRATIKERDEPLRCIGGGKLKPTPEGNWAVTGKSSVYGEDPDKERTRALFASRFSAFTFVRE